jgi:hypothetical protein
MDKLNLTKELTAQSLLKRSNRYYITTILDNLAKNIDLKIITNHETGNCSIVYELPATFTINNMNVKDAQILIYSEILKRYIDKGFKDVNLEITPNNTLLHIKWLNGLTDEERINRMDFIKERLIKNN